jgi:hypothetical protein
MTKFLRVLLVVVPLVLLASCGGEPPPSEGSTEEAVKVCPYLVPYCDPSCKLEGSCPQKCVCPGAHQCGDTKCPASDVCCPGTVNPDGTPNYTCYAGNVCIF